MSNSNNISKRRWLTAIIGGIVVGLTKNAAQRAAKKRPLAVGDLKTQQDADRGRAVDSSIVDIDFDEFERKIVQ